MDEYSMKDMTEGTGAYYNSKIEKDARKFEKRSIAVYKRLRKRYGWKDIIFRERKENKTPRQKYLYPKINWAKNWCICGNRLIWPEWDISNSNNPEVEFL